MLKIFILYIIIPVIIFLFGKNIINSSNDNLSKYKRMSKITKLPEKVNKNFVGNLVMFSPIIYITIVFFGMFEGVTYFSIGITFLFSLIWHIKDVSQKPIDIILSNFVISINNMKKNFFMKFTILMIISCFFTSLVMTKILHPIFVEKKIIIEETIEKNTEEEY